MSKEITRSTKTFLPVELKQVEPKGKLGWYRDVYKIKNKAIKMKLVGPLERAWYQLRTLFRVICRQPLNHNTWTVLTQDRRDTLCKMTDLPASPVDQKVRKPPIEELKTGRINPFQILFKDRSCDDQADEIMDYIGQFRSKPGNENARIAITYSANNDQAEDIYRGYKTGDYSIKGGNQAQVFKMVIEQIKKDNLQDNVHVLPVPTCLHAGGKDVSEEKHVEKAMSNIAQHIGAGWTVLGLQNDFSCPDQLFAIGGGVAGPVWNKSTQKGYTSYIMRELLEGTIPDPLQKAYQSGQTDQAQLLMTGP